MKELLEAKLSIPIEKVVNCRLDKNFPEMDFLKSNGKWFSYRVSSPPLTYEDVKDSDAFFSYIHAVRDKDWYRYILEEEVTCKSVISYLEDW